jgi:hypothetical protein
VAGATFDSEYETRRQGIRPFSFEGGGGGKKPNSMGYGSLSSRKIWHVPEKNLRPANGASLRTELIEQDLGVLQVGGIESLSEPVVDVGEHCAGFVAAIGIAQ